MAKGNWTGEKVKALVEAIKNKDIDAIEQAVVVTGKGSFPDKAYGRGWTKYGPDSVLAAAIETDDLELFDRLVELGMKVSSFGNNGCLGGPVDEVLFGEKSNLRSPEMLIKLANCGFDFSSIDAYGGVGSLRAFVIENAENLEVLEALEGAGLHYVKYGRSRDETIPWEIFLYQGRFELLDHFINKGFKPVRPLRLQIGTGEWYRNQESAVKSCAVIDFILERDLPTYGIVVMDVMTDEEIGILKYAIEKGVNLYNPDKLFALLNYELISTALVSGACEMKPEYVGPAKAASRDDLLKLYEEYGADLDDVTAEIVDELSLILRGAEYKTRWVYDDSENAAVNPKKMRVIGAIEDDATADWRKITELLSRVYCASFDNNEHHKMSKRAASLAKLAGSKPWVEIFEYCLGRFEGNLDLKLVVPMFKVKSSGFRGDEKGFGITFWYESDVAVYKLLAARGVEFLCKIDGDYGWDSENVEKNPDALPGDVFIWLAPDVSEFLFEEYGWEKAELEVSHTHTWDPKNRLGYDNLGRLLIGSGNKAAYKWFIENASNVKEFKKPAVKDVVASPLLRPYLESKKDGSVRSKDNVKFIMQTLNSEFKDDTLLYVRKASLDAAAAGQLKEKLKYVKSSEEKAIAKEAIALLDSSAVESKPVKKQSGEKKLTVSQTVTLVMNALDKGDASKIADLEPIAAKVPMVDCVELLEHAAANCDGAAIDALYDLLAPFECASTALHVALFSGNVAAAKALVAHGADLDGKLKKVDDKRTPAAKRGAREKRYSHGLVGSTYSFGRQVVDNLSEALLIWDGEIKSRADKQYVNEVSGNKAAETLIAIAGEKRFKKSIAVRLLLSLIDGASWRKILEAGILDESDIAELPWEDAVSSVYHDWPSLDVDMLKVIKDFAPEDVSDLAELPW